MTFDLSHDKACQELRFWLILVVIAVGALHRIGNTDKGERSHQHISQGCSSCLNCLVWQSYDLFLASRCQQLDTHLPGAHLVTLSVRGHDISTFPQAQKLSLCVSLVWAKSSSQSAGFYPPPSTRKHLISFLGQLLFQTVALLGLVTG